MTVMSPHHSRGVDEEEAFAAALQHACGAVGLAVGPQQQALMYAHFQQVVETNRRFNLTRITSPADAAVKHYADSVSLLAAPWIDRVRPMSLLDVGTGAGFPAVPLAIMCPAWEITAIDGTGKKARFTGEAAAALSLSNLVARQARAAELASEYPRGFDLIVMRAVAKIAAGLQEVHQLVRRGGAAVFYKTARIDPVELSRGSGVARSLGLREAAPYEITLPAPEGDLHRQFVRYER